MQQPTCVGANSKQVTLVFGNDAERIITDGDPVFHTAFIGKYLQTHDENPIINLPPFIQENIFDLLRDHLVHNTYIYQTVDSGNLGIRLMHSYIHTKWATYFGARNNSILGDR